jgi:hypothetical protein
MRGSKPEEMTDTHLLSELLALLLNNSAFVRCRSAPGWAERRAGTHWAKSAKLGLSLSACQIEREALATGLVSGKHRWSNSCKPKPSSCARAQAGQMACTLVALRLSRSCSNGCPFQAQQATLTASLRRNPPGAVGASTR